MIYASNIIIERKTEMYGEIIKQNKISLMRNKIEFNPIQKIKKTKEDIVYYLYDLRNKFISRTFNQYRDVDFSYFNNKKIDFLDFKDSKKFMYEMKNLFRTDYKHKSNDQSEDNFFILPKTNEKNKLYFSYEEFGKNEEERNCQLNQFVWDLKSGNTTFDDIITLRLEFNENPKEITQSIIYEIYCIMNYFYNNEDPEFPYYTPVLGIFHKDLDAQKNNKIHIHILLAYDTSRFFL